MLRRIQGRPAELRLGRKRAEHELFRPCGIPGFSKSHASKGEKLEGVETVLGRTGIVAEYHSTPARVPFFDFRDVVENASLDDASSALGEVIRQRNSSAYHINPSRVTNVTSRRIR